MGKTRHPLQWLRALTLNIHTIAHTTWTRTSWSKNTVHLQSHAYSKCTWIVAYMHGVLLSIWCIALSRMERAHLVIHSVRAIRNSKVHDDVRKTTLYCRILHFAEIQLGCTCTSHLIWTQSHRQNKLNGNILYKLIEKYLRLAIWFHPCWC